MADVDWPCTYQCINYNICKHKETITLLKILLREVLREKRDACPPYPNGCDCDNFAK